MADSEPDFVRIFCACLSDTPNINVIGASSDPFTAMEEIIGRLPDVLITDLFLPQKGPTSFLRLLSETLGTRMPTVVVCSGCLNRAMLASVKDQGIYRCFVKPMHCDTLISAVEEAFFAREKKKNGPEFVTLVSLFLKRVGSPSEQKGHVYIRDGIVLYAEAAKNPPTSVMDIYKELARKHSTTPESVERLCRNTLKTIWEKGDSKILNDLFAESVSGKAVRPSNSRFFATVASRLYRM